MIQANELRIGNLLEDHGEYLPVGFDTFKDWTKFNFGEFLKPIPITEDRLLKLGLVQNEMLFKPNEDIENKCKGDLGFKCPSFFFNKRLGKWMCCQTRVCVEYIHQVQNLVFALTGVELSEF